MSRQSSRRKFLKTTAAAGVGFWVAGGVEGAQRQPGPNERLNIGLIGAGGQGGASLDLSSTENIVALCDVDDQRAAGAYKRLPKATRYHDFRVMLEKQKNLDAVMVATPDNTHAIASIMAMRLGKHCYCEKPLTHDIWEARQMKETAIKFRVKTQMGNQGSSSNGFRTGVEIVQSGAIGDVREIHIWTNRPIWPQGQGRPKAVTAVPNTLNWDLWIGPAPMRPYNGERQKNGNPTYAPFNWRGWWDFGTGAIGDMACHTMNLPFRALRLGAPTAVSAVAAQAINNESPPVGCTITYEFPARGTLPACRLIWYERGLPPAALFQGQKPRGNSGSLMIGSKGTMYSPDDYGAQQTLLPMANFKDYRPPQAKLPRVDNNHRQEWVRACKGGPAAFSNFEDHAAQLTETALLGNVALRMGKRIVWDSAKLQVVGMPAANEYIRRTYRKGWNL